MSDPTSRVAFSMVSSLMHFMVSEGTMSKEQALRFLDGLIDGNKKTVQPDNEVITVLEFVRKNVGTAKEPTKN